MNYSLSKKIFSLNCRLDLNDSMFCEILKEELDLYPESSDNPNIVFTFTNSTKKFEFTLTNPKVHLSGSSFKRSCLSQTSKKVFETSFFKI